MDISQECMCKNNSPECVECWYAMPGYSVTETKRRLPLQTGHLTYDEEFAAFEHNDYDYHDDDPDDEGICYEVGGPRQGSQNWTATEFELDPEKYTVGDSPLFSAVPRKNTVDTSSNEHATGCIVPEELKRVPSAHDAHIRKFAGEDTAITSSNEDTPYWARDADMARLRWNALKRGRAKSNDEAFAFDLTTRFGECLDLMIAKHADYGPSNIANAPGGPLNGLRVRLHDKLARINNLIDKGIEPTNESLRDSFADLANYSVIGLMVIDQVWPGMENK